MLCKDGTVIECILHARAPMQVSSSSLVVSIDYKTCEAIRSVRGKEERKKLREGDSGFAVCTWEDGSQFQSSVANLMLTVKRAPLRKAANKKKPAAAKKRKQEAEEDESEDGEEDVSEEEEEEAEEAPSEAAVEKPAAKKAKAKQNVDQEKDRIVHDCTQLERDSAFQLPCGALGKASAI